MNNRKGFILYIVIAILLGLAILAFALNDFKRGAVTQLAHNVDQNRLILLCKSANSEALALIRTNANNSPKSNIFKAFRKIFPDFEAGKAQINEKIPVLTNFKPDKTIEIAKESGYSIDIECNVELTSFSKAEYKSVSAFNAYLDIKSKAYRREFPDNSIEVYERHDVRLVDVRHTLDKYVLFVKNYSPDLNNTQRRVIISGMQPPGGGYISRVYLGNDNYPDGKDPEKRLWLDICFDEIKEMPGFKKIFGKNTLSKFADNSGQNNLFFSRQVKFTNINLPMELFYHVPAVKKVYEIIVNQAADGIKGIKGVNYQDDNKRLAGDKLKSSCQQAMSLTNSNAAAYRICNDYVSNYKKSTYDGKTVNDYSGCINFRTILKTCIDNWVYQYGYLDANAVWDVANCERPNSPKAQPWVTALAYHGLVVKNEDKEHFGQYFYPYYKNKYNPERFRVGKMLKLYGDRNIELLGNNSQYPVPVLVEGPVYLRFFKIGYFNDFKQTLSFMDTTHDIHPETVPILFRGPNTSITFQNKQQGVEFSSNNNYFSDKTLMSRAVDDIPINALLTGAENPVTYFDGDGKTKTLSHTEVFSDAFLYPAQKNNSKTAGRYFGRLIDFTNVSYNYPSPKEFLEDRVRVIDGKKTLCIDGIMYIEKGDMDLTDINYFYGKGLIYLATGNVIFGNFRRIRDMDSVRFYLRAGDLVIGSSNSEVMIEASLAALYYKVGRNNPSEQGSLVLNNKKKVHIFGNLIVDYLYTQDSSGRGLEKDGTLLIEHDPLIMNPGFTIDNIEHDPYQVSIGKVKTAFAINAGGSEQ